MMLALLLTFAIAAEDAPEISRHRGARNAVVVMWPRVLSDDPTASALAGPLQARLAELVTEAAPDARRFVRPDPERSCPRDGCKGPAVGVLLAATSGGCAAVGLVSEPKLGSTRLVPWAGQMTLNKQAVDFREPPESAVVVNEFVPCGELLTSLEAGALTEAIGEVWTSSR